MKLFTKKILKCFSVLTLSLLIVLVGILGVYDYIIPDNVSFFEGDQLPVFMYAEASAVRLDNNDDTVCADYRLFDILPLKTVELSAYKDIQLIPGGMPFGVKFFTQGIVVAGFCDVESYNGEVNPAKSAGLKAGDIITHINGKPAAATADLSKAIEACGGSQITLTYIRGGEAHNVSLKPEKNKSDGKYKTGIIIRDSGAGIGTVSFIDPNSKMFAGLGHGICDSETGELIPMRRGAVIDVTISGIQKGLSGAPGEIKGFFNREKLGSMIKNSECGIFGVFTDIPKNPLSGAIPIGLKNELKEGEATIYCTLDDTGIHAYTINISDINKNADGGKCFNIKVTDPALIEKTGGIIQGMSGSPIIQNGKLVGSVTHVLVNDPTRGYGIFVENMLSEMSKRSA